MVGRLLWRGIITFFKTTPFTTWCTFVRHATWKQVRTLFSGMMVERSEIVTVTTVVRGQWRRRVRGAQAERETDDQSATNLPFFFIFVFRFVHRSHRRLRYLRVFLSPGCNAMAVLMSILSTNGLYNWTGVVYATVAFWGCSVAELRLSPPKPTSGDIELQLDLRLINARGLGICCVPLLRS